MPRGSPFTVVRVVISPPASNTVATVSPTNASTGRPSSRISTRGPRSSSGPSGSLDTRDHLLREPLERPVRQFDREPGRACPEEQPFASGPLGEGANAGGDLVGRA